MRNAAAQYLHKVNQQLACPRSIKRAFLRQLEAEVEDYCADHSGADLDQLSRQFGPPEEVAGEFLSEMGIQAVNRYNRGRQKLVRLTACVLLVVMILVSILGVRTYLLRRQLPNEELVASITYENEPDGFSWFPLRDFIFGSKEN